MEQLLEAHPDIVLGWVVAVPDEINAACRENGMSYSRFISGLRLAQVDVDRKVLAELAVSDPAAFAALVKVADEAQAAA